MPRICRICRKRERARDLVAPCLCMGVERWVHTDCLTADMRGGGDHATDECASCKTAYATAPLPWGAYTWRLARTLVAGFFDLIVPAIIGVPLLHVIGAAWRRADVATYTVDGTGGALLVCLVLLQVKGRAPATVATGRARPPSHSWIVRKAVNVVGLVSGAVWASPSWSHELAYGVLLPALVLLALVFAKTCAAAMARLVRPALLPVCTRPIAGG